MPGNWDTIFLGKKLPATPATDTRGLPATLCSPKAPATMPNAKKKETVAVITGKKQTPQCAYCVYSVLFSYFVDSRAYVLCTRTRVAYAQ